MTVEDVTKLVKAGVSEEIVIQQIRKVHTAFDLSTDQLIQLKSASVSDRIIQVMLDPSRVETETPPASPPATAPASASAPAPAQAGALAEVSEPAGHAVLPSEAGVYIHKAGQWAEVTPEIVYWKTGGVAKTVATLGVIKGNLNGRIVGPRGPNSYGKPLEFLIVTIEGVSIAEYQLLHLHPARESREFRTVTGGVFHSESGAARDLLRFESTKIAPHIFRVIFPAGYGPGEYGFLPPGSTGSSGKIYSFTVID